jgi:cytochrome bd-type quinol oxidase subunit 1
VIGARKIFQRMTTYSRYTVAMTFRICFTFGLITVIYDWCVHGTGRQRWLCCLFGGPRADPPSGDAGC